MEQKGDHSVSDVILGYQAHKVVEYSLLKLPLFQEEHQNGY